ncbi:MAG: TorF family putative porin [Hyphomonadaceae bacterium]|nr:TorF family putative porin [Hyphomonadaceae bacterium]
MNGVAPLSDIIVLSANTTARPVLLEAPEPPPEGWDVTSTVALVSDYRLGGVTRSAHAAALQTSIDAHHSSGWSVGGFAANVDKRKGGDFELEVHAAKSFAIDDTEFSVGALWAVIPQTQGEDFGIAQFSASRAIGPVDVTLAVNYAWPQSNLDDEDNTSIRLRARTPIGRLAGVPITLGASVGYSEGELTLEDKKNDWSVSAAAAFGAADIALAYVDTDLDSERGDPALIFSIAVSF